MLSLILCSWVRDSPLGAKRRDSRQGTDSVPQHFDENDICVTQIKQSKHFNPRLNNIISLAREINFK